MKGFALLFFAFTILALGIMPCADVHAGNNETIATVKEAQDHHEAHQDVCPPFCSCNCCNTSAESIPFEKLLTDIEISAKPDPGFNSSEYIYTYQISIFQPPRLS